MKYKTILKKDKYGDEKLTVAEMVVEPHDNWCGIWTMAPVIKAAVEAVRDNKNGIPGTFFPNPDLFSTPSEGDWKIAKANMKRSYRKIIKAMDIIIADTYHASEEQRKVIDDGFLELALVWHTLWT